MTNDIDITPIGLLTGKVTRVRPPEPGTRLHGRTIDEERLAKVERLCLEELMTTADANEGLNAFLEKRKPAWKGR